MRRILLMEPKLSRRDFIKAVGPQVAVAGKGLQAVLGSVR